MYKDKISCDIIRKKNKNHCDLINQTVNNLVVDHLHTGESMISDLPNNFDGHIRGVINSNSNITLGYIMSDCKKYDLNVFEYLDMIKSFLKQEPKNGIYYNHPKDLLNEFIAMSECDQIEKLEYDVGECRDGDKIEQYRHYLREEYKMTKLLKI